MNTQMGRGSVTMEAIYSGNRYDGRYRLMTRAHDAIGWQHFMEGKWTVELITKLLELTHGEWLFHNIGHVRKEEIQMEILEEQQALGLGTAGAGILDKNISPWGNAI